MELSPTANRITPDKGSAIYSLMVEEDVLPNVTLMLDNGSGAVELDTYILSIGDIETRLQELNYDFTVLMIPAIVFLSVLMIVGIVGNILVLYVYLSKVKASTTRCYVLSLAVFDLLSCCISIPGEIIDISFNYTFNITYLCKILRTVNAFTTFSSGFILLVVAVDRYKKICRPLHKQLTLRTANIVILVDCALALGLALPAIVLYGKRTITTGDVLVNGTDCSTSDIYIGTLYPLIYNGVHFLVFILGSSILITLYSLIGKRVWRHKVFRQSRLSIGRKPVRISSNTDTDGSSPITEVVHCRAKRLSRIISTDSNPDALISKTRRTDNRKTTLMLFLITIVFIVSFLPHLVLMALKALDKNSLSGSGGLSELAFNILLRSYFINSASNPIIYSFCSLKFRNECKKLFKCTT